MTDAVLATVFILMLLLPCASAVISDRQREEELEAARAEKRIKNRTVEARPVRRQAVTRQAVARHTVVEQKIVEKVLPAKPVEAVRPVQAPVAPAVAEVKVTPVARAVEVPAAVVFRPVVRNPERALTESILAFEPLGIAHRLPGTEFGTGFMVQRRAERTQSDDLMARVEAARAEAAALLAVARAAAEKAYAAAQRAAQAEYEMQQAAEAAAMARARYTRTHSLEGPTTPIPETHPSLDFPRSRGPRRAA